MATATAVGIGTVPLATLDVWGGLKTTVDGAITAGTLLVTSTVMSTTTSIGFGVDPARACGYITSPSPLLLQASVVEIGANGGTFPFRVQGGGACQSLVVDTLTADSIVVNGIAVQGNQWTLTALSTPTSTLQYSGTIQVSTLQATYVGLALATPSTVGILQPAVGLRVAAGVLSVSLGVAEGGITGITVATDWFWAPALTVNTALFSNVFIPLMGGVPAWTPTVAGTYRVSVTGVATGAGMLYLQRYSGALHPLASMALGSLALSVIVPLLPTDSLVLFSDVAPINTTGVRVSAVQIA